MNTVIVNHNLIGDALMCTPGIYEYRKSTGDHVTMIVGPEVYNDLFIDSPCVDKVIKATEEQISNLKDKYQWLIGNIGTIENKNFCIMDISKAFYEANRKIEYKVDQDKKLYKTSPHLSETLANQLGIKLKEKRYYISINDNDLEQANSILQKHDKPVIICAALSKSCTSRDQRQTSTKLQPNKMLTANVWQPVIDHFSKDYSMVFVGAKNEQTIDINNAHWELGQPIKVVAAMCKQAAAVISIDTGILHIAQAVEAKTVAICAAVLSTSVILNLNSNNIYCVDHSEHSTGPRGIYTVTPEEIIVGVETLLK